MKKFVLAAALVTVLVFSGCGQREQANERIIAAGSTSVGPVIEALADMYTQEHPELGIDVEQTGSGAGVTSCGDGTADIGMISRDLKEQEQQTYPDMHTTLLCVDGLAVVVNADCPVKSLTQQQVRDIFMGEITDWSEVGGDAGAITLYSRDSVSGTREAFQSLFLGKDDAGEQIEIEDTRCIIVDSNGAIGTAVQADRAGIGYMSLGIVYQYGVTALTIDGVEATIDNVISSVYPYYRSFNLLTMGEPTGAVADFITYCTTDKQAADYMQSKGYVLLP